MVDDSMVIVVGELAPDTTDNTVSTVIKEGTSTH